MFGVFLCPKIGRKEIPMREMTNETNCQSHTEHREVQIGKTIYQVHSVFNGVNPLDKLLLEWAVKKTISATNS